MRPRRRSCRAIGAARARSSPTWCAPSFPCMRQFGGVVPEIAARAHVEVLDQAIAQGARRRQARLGVDRRRRRDSWPWLDRRPDRRRGDGKGHCARTRTSLRRCQSSRGACVDPGPDPWASAFLTSCCSSPADTRSCSSSRASATTRVSGRRWTTRSAKPSTRPPSCSGLAIRAARRSRPWPSGAGATSRCRGRCSAGRSRISRLPD